MISASQYKSKTTKAIRTIKLVICPACNKQRLHKYLNEDGSVIETSDHTVEVRDGKRFLDVCGHCIDRYRKSDETFVRENMRKLAKAFMSGESKDGDTDHKDFSLN